MKTMIIDGQEYALVPIEDYKTDQKHNEIEVDNFYYGCVVEDEDHCFEFSVLVNYEDGKMVFPENPMASIEWTHKKGAKKDWESEYLDNPDWLRRVVNEPTSSIEDYPEGLDYNGTQMLKSLIRKMEEIGWL